MKNKFCHAALAILLGVFSLAGCNDDDSPIRIEQDLSGEYKSEVTVTITNIDPENGKETTLDPVTVPQNFTVAPASTDNTHLDLTLLDVRFADQDWNDLALRNIKVGRYAGRYTLTAEDGQSIDLNGLGRYNLSLQGSGNPQAVSTVLTLSKSDQRIEILFTGTKLTGTESSQGAIESFVFDANYDKANAVVSQQPQIEGNTITFHVEAGADVTGLKPTIVTTPEETTRLYPGSHTAVDFSQPVTYIVAAEDGTRIEYTVNVLYD